MTKFEALMMFLEMMNELFIETGLWIGLLLLTIVCICIVNSLSPIENEDE